MLKRTFGAVEVIGAEGGMHFVWKLPPHLPPASEIQERALKVGVGVYTIGSGGAVHFGDASEIDRYLVLGFSSLSEREIELGISRLAAKLGQKPPQRA